LGIRSSGNSSTSNNFFSDLYQHVETIFFVLFWQKYILLKRHFDLSLYCRLFSQLLDMPGTAISI
jgi:hypothetical protein